MLRYKPGHSPQIEPDIALSVPVPKLVDGRQEWTFQIRKGIVCPKTPWTAAYELTADDVVYSIRKSADPSRSAYAGEYVGITARGPSILSTLYSIYIWISRSVIYSKITDNWELQPSEARNLEIGLGKSKFHLMKANPEYFSLEL